MKVLVGFVVFAALISIGSALADQRLPTKITCKGKHPNLQKSITITGLDTNQPDSDFYDAPLINFENTKDDVTAIFSSECGNYYQVSFAKRDLAKLAKRKKKSIQGELFFYNNDTPEEPQYHEVKLTCRL